LPVPYTDATYAFRGSGKMRLLGRVTRLAPSIVDPRISSSAGMVPEDTPAAVTAVPGRQAGSIRVRAPEFDRIARLAAMALASPRASVTIVGGNNSAGWIWASVPTSVGPLSAVEQSLGQFVIDSARELSRPSEPAGLMAWAGFPVREPAGRSARCASPTSDRGRGAPTTFRCSRTWHRSPPAKSRCG